MNKVLKELENDFDNPYWQRGREYYREGLIRDVKQKGARITATCKGNSLYRMHLDLASKEMSCSCPCDFNCKHLAALIMWLNKNKPLTIADLDQELAKCSKSQLIERLKILLERHPEDYKYFQKPSKEEITRLIKKFWIPNDYTSSFFNELDYIKENIWAAKDFELTCALLRRLIDMYDHDPDSSEVDDAICTFLKEVEQQLTLNKKQKQELRTIIEDYPFDDFL